jgi:hypothetical protein
LILISGDKPFSCDICQKKFALSCNLRAHLKTHEAEYQNSATSLALYRRALASLGGQDDQDQSSSPFQQREPESPDEEPIEEDLIDEDDEKSSNDESSPRSPTNLKSAISDPYPNNNRMLTVTAV